MTLRAAAEQALKPCPFCGSEPYSCRHLSYSNWGVTCECGAIGPTKNAGYRPLRESRLRAHNEAVAAWNERAALAAEQPQPEALGYATRLATSLWEKHYKAVSPHWRPLNDTLGVLTQIDNMTCRLVPPPPAAEPSDVTDAARYRWLRDHRGGGHAVVNGDLLEGSELDENIDAALRAAAAARTKC